MLFQGIGTEHFADTCQRAMSDLREYLERVASLRPKPRPGLPPLPVMLVAIATAAAPGEPPSPSDYSNAVRHAALRRMGMELTCNTACCCALALQAQLPGQVLPGAVAQGEWGKLDSLPGSCAAALRLVLGWWVARGDAGLR